MKPTQTSTFLSLPHKPGFFSGKFPKQTQCQPSLLILPNGLQNSLPCYTFKRKNSSTWSTVTSISTTPEPCPPVSYCSIIEKPICHLGVCVLRVLGMHGRQPPWLFFAGFGWFLCSFLVPPRPWGRNSVHSDLSGGGASVFWHVMGQSETSSQP